HAAAVHTTFYRQVGIRFPDISQGVLVSDDILHRSTSRLSPKQRLIVLPPTHRVSLAEVSHVAPQYAWKIAIGEVQRIASDKRLKVRRVVQLFGQHFVGCADELRAGPDPRRHAPGREPLENLFKLAILEFGC